MKLRSFLITILSLLTAQVVVADDRWPTSSGGGGGGTNPSNTIYASTSCTGVASPCYATLQEACTAANALITANSAPVTVRVAPGVYAVTPPLVCESPAPNTDDRQLTIIGDSSGTLHAHSAVRILPTSDSAASATVRTANATWIGIEVLPGADNGDVGLLASTAAGTGGFGEVNLINFMCNSPGAVDATGKACISLVNTNASGASNFIMHESRIAFVCATSCTATSAAVRVNVLGAGGNASFSSINSTLSIIGTSATPTAQLIDVQAAEVVSVQNSILTTANNELIEVDENDVTRVVIANTMLSLTDTPGRLLMVDDTTPDAVSPVRIDFFDLVLPVVPTNAPDTGANGVVGYGGGMFYGRTDTPPTCAGSASYERAGLLYYDMSLEVLCSCNGSVWERLDTGVDGTDTNCEP